MRSDSMLLCCETNSIYGLLQGPDGTGPIPNGSYSHTGERRDVRLPRVLVVDDERLIADTVAKILNLHGFDAFCSYNGEDALQLAKSFRPDYLLSDVMMPKLNGVDLAMAMERI